MVQKRKKINFILLILIGIVAIAAVVASIFLLNGKKGKEKEAQVVTVASLQKIINVSELSTFQAVYNGVADVMNEEDSEQCDYHVSYEAKVNAGIEFDKVKIDLDEEKKSIVVTLPEIEITDTVVDITTLDYIWEDKDANTDTVSQEAYKACIADVEKESKEQQAIYDLAKQNAKNVVEALITPFTQQFDSEYTVTIN